MRLELFNVLYSFCNRIRYPLQTGMIQFKQFKQFSRFKEVHCVRGVLYSTQDNVRVRFAPSPTGFLHLGGLRTALYNFLFATKHKGKFILRIEDTDQSRLIDGASQRLYEDLVWAGIKVHESPFEDGDYGPYKQSERLSVYKEQVQILLNNGSAYHCFCSDKRLDLLRREALRAREVPKYDNRCRHLNHMEVENRLSRGEKSCIRFKLSSEVTNFNDLIYGNISYDIAANEGDPVIIKGDGYPTYHFANVVDDHFMKISHVLRGVEWQISTTKHLLLYRAFDWQPPVYGHLPLLMNSDGSKLSKRQGDIRISQYRENGILPLALLNFIVNSGGGFSKDLEQNLKPKCYTLQELAEQFDVERINNHSGKLMTERLLEFNRLELKRKLENANEENELIEQVKNLLTKRFPERLTDGSLQLSYSHIRFVLHWATKRISKLSDLISNDLIFLWIVPVDYTIDSKYSIVIQKIVDGLSNAEDLERSKLNIYFKMVCNDHGLKFSTFMKMLRSILSGLKEGPSVAEMIEILGKENTIHRLQLCLNKNKGSMR